MPLNDLPYQLDDTYSPVYRAGDKLSAAIRLPLIKQIDSENITAASKIFKIERKCQQSDGEERNFTNTRHLMSELGEKKINSLTPRGANVVYLKYQITITFTRLLEAHDSII